MAQEKIIIKFEAKGDKALNHAIRQLHASQVLLDKGTEAYARELKKLDALQKKYNGNTALGIKNNRLLNNAFATLRSKILLFNFAMALGIRQLIGFAKEASKVESMSRAFNTLAGSAGNSKVALQALKVATNGTMSEFDLFQQANNAMVLGITKNSNEMAEMFDIAQRLGRALGKDTKMSVESLITGIGRQSRLMLDNIGIIVKADEAYESYAKKIGTTADKLTDADKKQAFLTATMDSARAKVAALGVETLSSQDSFDAFSATVDDLQVLVGNKLKGAFAGAMDAFVKFVEVNKEADVETAMASKSYELMAITVERLEKALRDSERTSINQGIAFNAGINVYTLSAEKIEKMKNEIANLRTEMSKLLLAGTPRLPIFEEFPDFERHSELTIEVMDSFNQEAETLLNDFYINRHKQQIDAFAIEQATLEEAARATIDNEIELQSVLTDINNHFIDKRNKKNNEAARERLKLEKLITKSVVSSSFQQAIAYDNAGKAAEAAARDIIASKIQSMVMSLMEDALTKFGFAGLLLAGTASAVVGSLVGQAQRHWKFEQGGLVGGRRHSQGGTMIEAEQGEFVMSRSAVQSIGVNALNRMNQGGSGGAVNVTISGNVMSQDFVEGELAEQIKEAVRRGTDFGIS